MTEGGSIEERALAAACAVAAQRGVPCGDAEVVYSGSNVLVRLSPSPVVARVMSGTAVLHDDPKLWLSREVAVLGHLAPLGLAVPPSSVIPPGPYRSDGVWMTFASWVEIEGRTEPDDAEALALALRRLHDALADFTGDLGGMADLQDDIERLRGELRPTAGLPAETIDSMGERLSALTELVFRTSLPAQPLHGDASLSNLLRTPTGFLWNDFEDVLRGPLHWDLAGYVMALEDRGADAAFVRRTLDAYGWGDASDLAPFTAAHELYGEIWTAYDARRRA
ncbi:MAG TPA: aminoglycoside phosphotransferase family protein [Solirubrobacterales bacterium]|nr:aminoglycoside phosphotransferase family protein [Solirubrobacterales bacterium]